MIEQGIKAALVLTALAAGSAGALVASETAGGAKPAQAISTSVHKADRLDSQTVIAAYARDRIGTAFAIAESGNRGATPAVARGVEDCLPACSSVVYKSETPGTPSRIVPGAAR
ncbi:hypothetical protein [Prosthecomicrobium sp. N25]|uniref:hypothetical protein n=1 Tax=Prosthecomicrobium sp. N25 TaxID=3129254 RepID=UPI003076D709